MKKTSTIIALVGLALVLFAGNCLAAGTSGRASVAVDPVQPPNHIISFTGTIQAIDSQDQSILVTIQMTNYPYIAKRGDTLWVETTDDTLYYVWLGDLRTTATFADLQEGQSVSINADISTTALTASRIEVDKPRY